MMINTIKQAEMTLNFKQTKLKDIKNVSVIVCRVLWSAVTRSRQLWWTNLWRSAPLSQ